MRFKYRDLIRHSLIKQFIIFLCILVISLFLVKEMSRIQGDSDMLIIIATISGLILAGALSGFLQFSYKGTKNKVQLFLGHLATGIQQLVIGSLLIVSTLCLYNYNLEYTVWFYFSILSVALFVSLIAYDIFDMSILINQ